ncbi:calcium uniporter protein 2, mitochondrial-like [Macadamia integrifolia]|uniref:calcium uniporter protein 2, mitochondrial-like n=1 Tax=Macadamia integrifolia TaxID=60698 RepID=UPI001C4F808A|nr:calcium uniporter protein 2, mitochondrial-like [Macadamia integrifolia]
MALRRNLGDRLFNINKISSPSNSLVYSPFSFPSSEQPLIPPDPAKLIFHREFRSSSGTGKDGFFRRFIQRRAIVQSALVTPELRSFLLGDKLMEKLKGMNLSKDRLRLDGLNPPVMRSESDTVDKISIMDARKLLRLSRLERLKTKLGRIPKNCISYSEFVQICSDGCSTPDQGLEFAKMLDESGAVIVLGDIVFLRPDQVAKAMEAIISLSVDQPMNDARRKELEGMEHEKVAIDRKADALVRRELWTGLGFLFIQTAAFMRLTFWELSWDVMEPICFYVTSIYFMAGYTFFMRTAKDPSFEGFYESRFVTKQKRLMKNKKFDIQRFDELRRACYSFSSETPSSLNHSQKTLMGAALHY